MQFRLTISATLLVLATANAAAATWTHTTSSDFLAGSSDGHAVVVASGDGAVRLAKLAGSLGAFQNVTPLPMTCQGPMTWTYGDRIFVAGGTSNTAVSAAIFSNDVDASGNFSSSWTFRGTLPSVQLQGSATRWADRLYAGGGQTNGVTGYSNTLRVAVLDSTGMPGSWTDIGPLPQVEFDGHLVAAQGKLFYFSGNNNVSYATNSVYSASILADGSIGAWSAQTSRSMVMRLYNASYLGGRVFIIGGETGSYAGNSNVIQASIDDQGAIGGWTNANSLPQPRSYLSCNEGDGAGKVFILGGKTYPPNTAYNTVYSATVDGSGNLGTWATESSLPQARYATSWVIAGGKIHYIGGADPSVQYSSVYSASLNQGSANASSGTFVDRFDLGSVVALGNLTWTTNDLAHVGLQARVAGASGVFGAWSTLNNSGSIDLSALASTGRYIEYRAKLSDNANADVELQSVTISDPATPTPTTTATPSFSPTFTMTATPSQTAAATSTPACGLSITGYSGIGKAGDILVSLRLSGGLVQGLDSDPNGAYYNYASISDGHLDGLTTDYDDISKVRASREDNNDIVLLDASGNVVAGQTWTFPVGVTPKIGAFDPLTGDFYVPDQAGSGIWFIKHGTLTPVMIPGSPGQFANPLCAVFDNSGNLYISNTGAQNVMRYSAAALAAWSASSVTPTATLYDTLGVDIQGLVYDGGNHLYGIFPAGNVGLVDIVMGGSTGSHGPGIMPVWPALPNIPVGEVGNHPQNSDGLVMDLNGDLWSVESGTTMRGIYKMDINGNILDWRPLTVAGQPDDLAIAGLRLPHGPISCLSPTATRTSTPSRTPSSTVTATFTFTATLTPTTTPTMTPNFTGPGACPVTPSVSLPWTGLGTPGDILMTAIQSTNIFGFNPVTETYYKHSTVTANIDGGLSVDPSDPTKLRVVQATGLGTIAANGAFTGSWGTSVAAGLLLGAFAPDGSYWITDQAAARVFRFPVGGGVGQGKYFSTGANGPTGLIFDAAGNLYVTDAANARVLKVAAASQGTVTMTATVLCTGVPNGGGIAYDGDRSLYFMNDPGTVGQVNKVDTITGARTVITSTFAPLTENGGGSLYYGGPAIFGLDGALWVGQYASGTLKGLLKLTSTGTPLKFYPFPATIGGVSTTNLRAGGLAVLGYAGIRNCPAVATGTPTSTATRTASPSATQTQTATPSATALIGTATLTAIPTSVTDACPDCNNYQGGYFHPGLGPSQGPAMGTENFGGNAGAAPVYVMHIGGQALSGFVQRGGRGEGVMTIGNPGDLPSTAGFMHMHFAVSDLSGAAVMTLMDYDFGGHKIKVQVFGPSNPNFNRVKVDYSTASGMSTTWIDYVYGTNPIDDQRVGNASTPYNAKKIGLDFSACGLRVLTGDFADPGTGGGTLLPSYGTWAGATGSYLAYGNNIGLGNPVDGFFDDVRTWTCSTPTFTATATPTLTPTATRTASPTFSATVTPSRTPSPSATFTVTNTGLTPVVSFTSTVTPSVTKTQTPASGGTPVATSTPVPIPSHTCIIVPAKTPGEGGPHKVIVRAKEGGRCSVKVFRPEGRICNRLWEGQMSPNEMKVLFWNNDDDGGQRVASGIYLVVFQDGNGALHKSKCAIIR